MLFWFIVPSTYNSAVKAKEYLAGQGCEIVYRLKQPAVYQLDPAAVRTWYGANTFSCGSETLTVEYAADTKLYIDNAISALAGNA